MEYNNISLVTGAAGFMGSHLVEYLVRKGMKVRATSRPRKETTFFDKLGVRFIPSDLTRPETLPPLFEGSVDCVFHLGAICNFSTPFKKLYPTNVEGVRRITELALKAGVKRFVHVTSTSVYGYYQGAPFVEESPRNPRDDYGKSKKEGEDIVLGRLKEGLPAIIARPCTVYGPRCADGAGKAFSRPTSITAIPGGGRQLLSNIRAEDVAAALYYLALRDESVGEIYNLSEETHPTLKEALVLAAKTYGTKPPTRHLPLALVKTVARVDGFISRLKGRIPDLEVDAVKYLYDDYVVDNSKLLRTGFKLNYPDFRVSMRELGKLSKKG
ncbi:MAG: NAD-dependent epimerase/dehydratase family protein [Deltaproteobacteria bacterium]|nr:NAD-dependent epimerase/dehydratase family protein [Deltaproteobacteria bacterium]